MAYAAAAAEPIWDSVLYGKRLIDYAPECVDYVDTDGPKALAQRRWPKGARGYV